MKLQVSQPAAVSTQPVTDTERLYQLLAKMQTEQTQLLQTIARNSWSGGAAGRLAMEDGVIFESRNERFRDPRSLIPHSVQMYSQNYEDGMIAEIFNRIGARSKRFVEIGCGDGKENNTRLLLEMGWSGLWLDGHPQFIDRVIANCKPFLVSSHLFARQDFVTKENVAEMVAEHGYATDIDFFSLDVDHNTPHIWEGLADLKARVACIEYNPSLPPSYDWCVPYEPKRMWDGKNYYGASLKHLELMGRRFGYALVGCDWRGTNAFFVHENEDLTQFQDPFTAEFHYEPARYQLLAHRGHPRS